VQRLPAGHDERQTVGRARRQRRARKLDHEPPPPAGNDRARRTLEELAEFEEESWIFEPDFDGRSLFSIVLRPRFAAHRPSVEVAAERGLVCGRLPDSAAVVDVAAALS
jgi:hypothetical protein